MIKLNMYLIKVVLQAMPGGRATATLGTAAVKCLNTATIRRHQNRL